MEANAGLFKTDRYPWKYFLDKRRSESTVRPWGDDVHHMNIIEHNFLASFSLNMNTSDDKYIPNDTAVDKILLIILGWNVMSEKMTQTWMIHLHLPEHNSEDLHSYRNCFRHNTDVAIAQSAIKLLKRIIRWLKLESF